jgi:hypothetical protein
MDFSNKIIVQAGKLFSLYQAQDLRVFTIVMSMVVVSLNVAQIVQREYLK